MTDLAMSTNVDGALPGSPLQPALSRKNEQAGLVATRSRRARLQQLKAFEPRWLMTHYQAIAAAAALVAAGAVGARKRLDSSENSSRARKPLQNRDQQLVDLTR
jgi:hypothetical protein